jgi:choline dehydrogenase
MRYDVIVVGAGSAGCVLAARLSEDPRRAVLLLEAGPDYPDAAGLPVEIASGHMPAFTHDWGYVSEAFANGRTVNTNRGRLVGGCSATNGTAAVRGHSRDYDDWAARGNPGWSFADVLPFFRRLEHDMDFGGDWHGQAGPLPIRRYTPEERTPIHTAVLEAAPEAGFARIDDLNAPDAMGAGPLPVNVIDGRRQSTALTYLAPARTRPNLTIRSGVLIDRVLFEGARAVGVQLAAPAEAIAADQIIVAAGAYGSPALLMRSGIGPADDLRALGIHIQADLPGVGQNLSDHPLLNLQYAAMPVPAESTPFFQTAITLKSSPAAPSYDLHIYPMSTFPWAVEESPTGASCTLFVSLLKPTSRGWVRLRSADPAVAPRIDLGYFTHPDDMPRMIAAVRAARRLARTAPLAAVALSELQPQPGTPDDDDALEAFVWSRVETYHHPVGTCAMGPANDSMAVVDGRGRVHGVAGLSVIDASIMPTVPAANTNLPTIMVAERCAAWLTGSG